MELYLVRGDPAFSWLRSAPEETWSWRGGDAVRWEWEEPNLAVAAAEGGGGKFIAVDCLPMQTGADGVALSGFAREKLSSLLEVAGELWPVRVLQHQYWWFNCLACVDALDRARTDADWSVVDGDWGSFEWITLTRRLEFDAGPLQVAPAIFRVPEYPQGVLFGTQAFRSAVESSALTGFQFDLVWSRDEGGVTDPPGVSLKGVFDPVEPGSLERKRAWAKDVIQNRPR